MIKLVNLFLQNENEFRQKLMAIFSAMHFPYWRMRSDAYYIWWVYIWIFLVPWINQQFSAQNNAWI